MTYPIRVLFLCTGNSCRSQMAEALLRRFGGGDFDVYSAGYSPRCSCTSRTARSRTSGENLFDLFMALFSQVLEPPQKPGAIQERFNCRLFVLRILPVSCAVEKHAIRVRGEWHACYFSEGANHYFTAYFDGGN
jgi:hypothetical protein